MADFSVTAASFRTSANAALVQRVAGAALTRGQTLYQDVDGTVKPFKANGGSPINKFLGWACEDVASGQTLLVCTSDPALTPGYAVAAGAVVIGSGAVAGNSAPVADNTTGWYVTILGVGIGGNLLNASAPLAAGVAT